LLGQNIGNNNGVIERSEILDTDGDGIPNYRDKDSDNDGLPDILENNRYVFDESGNSNNSLDYGTEYNIVTDPNHLEPGTGPGQQPLLDTDGDFIYNYMDIDSDGDGIGDWIEAWDSDIDTDGDGSISISEYNTAMTSFGNDDGFFTSNEYTNTDNVDLPDIFDLDSDNDNIADRHESDMRDQDSSTVVTVFTDIVESVDTDTDPDFRDMESDGDGILDIDEAGDANLNTPPLDSDNDGKFDHQDLDSDDDLLADADEILIDPTGVSKKNPDTDGDLCSDACEVFGNLFPGLPAACPYVGKPWSFNGSVGNEVTNPLNADTDGGGDPDCLEAMNTSNPVDVPTDDVFYTTDTDGDGLTNGEEINIVGSPYNDPDWDNDGVSDGCEVLGDAYAGVLPCLASGQPWSFIGSPSSPVMNPNNPDTDGGGIPDGVELTNGKNPLDFNDDDSDGDGIGNDDEIAIGLDPNLADSNGDCIDDGDEIGPDPSRPVDSDGDGIPDIFDIDNDNDGLTDCEEIQNGTQPANAGDIQLQGSGGCGLAEARNPGDNERIPFGIPIVLLVVPFLFLCLLKILTRRKEDE